MNNSLQQVTLDYRCHNQMDNAESVPLKQAEDSETPSNSLNILSQNSSSENSNDLDSREVLMPKEKSVFSTKSSNSILSDITIICSRFIMIAKRVMGTVFSSKISLVFIVIVLAFGLTVLLLGRNVPTIAMDKDRAVVYNVKILPADMDDSSLKLIPKEGFSYLAVIDAGSSGCRAHVYRYGKIGAIDGPIYVLPEHVSKKVKPGLSSFSGNPSDAGASLQGLISFLKEEVPENDWSVTPIWLKATAGLRMLPVKDSEAILGSVRKFLGDRNKSPFYFLPSYARVIPGKEEGGFGWIAYNYLNRIIGPKRDYLSPVAPFAVVEMGGASSQVTQVAANSIEAMKIPSEYKFAFDIEGEFFVLYTHSYLGFGAEQARERLNKFLVSAKADSASVADPCLNRGYSRDESTKRSDVYEGVDSPLKVLGQSDNAGTCLKTLTSLIPKNDKCDGGDYPRSFDCVFQPKFVSSSQNFLVFENFYYVASGIGVLPANHSPDAQPTGTFPLKTTPGELEEAANAVCGVEWSQLQSDYPKDKQPKDVNVKWCFAASYVTAFLTEGLGVDKNKILTVQKDVGSSEIEWALGAAYKEVADFLKRKNLRTS